MESQKMRPFKFFTGIATNKIILFLLLFTALPIYPQGVPCFYTLPRLKFDVHKNTFTVINATDFELSRASTDQWNITTNSTGDMVIYDKQTNKQIFRVDHSSNIYIGELPYITTFYYDGSTHFSGDVWSYKGASIDGLSVSSTAIQVLMNTHISSDTNKWNEIGTSTKTLDDYADAIALSTGTVPKPVTYGIGFTKDCDYICDGTDDDIQIQLAITALANGGSIALREGSYSISTAIAINTSSITIIGQGNRTVLTNAGSNNILNITAPFCKISYLTIYDNNSNNSPVYVYSNGVYCSITNCYVKTENQGSYILRLTAGYATLENNYINSNQLDGTIAINGNYNKIINNLLISLNSEANVFINIANGSHNIFTGNTVYNNRVSGNGSGAFTITGISSYNVITSNIFQGTNIGATRYVLNLTNGYGNKIADNRITATGSTGYGIALTANAIKTIIENNNFIDCISGQEISDSGTNTRKRNNISATGTWLDGDYTAQEIQVAVDTNTLNSLKADRADVQSSTDTLNDKINEILGTTQRHFLNANADGLSYEYYGTSTALQSTPATRTKTLSGTAIIISSWVVNLGNISVIPSGIWELEFYANISNTNVTRVYFDVYDGTGTAIDTTENFIASTYLSEPISQVIEEYFVMFDTISYIPKTRYLSVIMKANESGANPVFSYYLNGSYDSKLILPVLREEVSIIKIIAGNKIGISPETGIGNITVSWQDSFQVSPSTGIQNGTLPSTVKATTGSLPLIYSTYNVFGCIFTSTDNATDCTIQPSTYTIMLACDTIITQTHILSNTSGNITLGISISTSTDNSTFVEISTGEVITTTVKYDNTTLGHWTSTKIFSKGTIIKTVITNLTTVGDNATFIIEGWKALW